MFCVYVLSCFLKLYVLNCIILYLVVSGNGVMYLKYCGIYIEVIVNCIGKLCRWFRVWSKVWFMIFDYIGLLF